MIPNSFFFLKFFWKKSFFDLIFAFRASLLSISANEDISGIASLYSDPYTNTLYDYGKKKMITQEESRNELMNNWVVAFIKFKYKRISVRYQRIKIEGTRATVRLNYDMTLYQKIISKGERKVQKKEEFILELIDGKWYIVSEKELRNK